MEQTERAAASPSPPPPPPAPLPADEDVRRSPGQPEAQLAAEGPQSGSQEPRGSGRAAGWELQQTGGSALQLEFQDSSSSPGFSLVPQRSGVDHDVTEESLFQKSDTEFAPLRAYPDLSVASDRFPSPPEDSTTQVSDYASLSQHPLAQATLLSEDMTSSCSLSQVSVSLQEGSSRESSVHSPHAADDELEVSSSQGKDTETPTDASVQTEALIDEAHFLRSDVAAQDLLERLQKDVGVPSTSSSSTVASSSALGESESMRTSADVSTASREGPPGEASHPPHAPGPPHTLSPEVANITVGSRSTEPDDGMAALHRELLSESAMGSSHEAQESVSPPTEVLQGKASVTRTHPGGAPQAGPAAAEPDLLSSSSQTGIDGSYLGFLPQSQSTPGVFKAPSKSSVHRAFEPLSTIESSFVCGGGAAAPGGDDPRRRTADLVQRGAATTRVQSLPSLNYLQKVDAWRENQSLGRTSLFDSLALQGFHGVSPKQRAYDAVSDTLNRILTQQAQGLGPAAAVGSSPGRGEAAGAHTSASPGGRSQSHSSLSTVVMSTRKDQKTRSAGAAARPSPLANLGAFSDVSIEMDLMLSSSQDSSSSNSATKVGTSVGASSISLEVDNYAPYWTSKMATPPPARPRELNIEERIPVYLQNLGIDQSVSTILTPFVPRGPIREPEFSPTDLCTIKGSIGTPTKSAQPSEGGTPYKGEFSRSSVLSVASSISVPPSLESLGLGFRERARAPSAEFLQRAGSSTSSRSGAEPGDLFLFAKDSCRSRWAEQSPEEPSDNAAALLEIHRILSRAGNDPSAASRLRSDDDLFVSPRERGARPRDSSSTTTSVATGSRTGPSLLWAGSSSDTLLTSEKLQDTSAGSEVAVETGVTQNNRGATGLLVSTESARRAEPEGCSAAPPDGIALTQPQQAADEDQQSGSAPSSSSSPAETQDADQAALSDGSSGSSLAARVAALLQSESANTVMSSTDSSTEQDQNPAREWIKLKLSGQQCEPLQLDQEDRERIEEIKRELLLKHPVQSQGSTDTESSTESPSHAHTEPRPPVQPPPNLLLADLETQVRQIAAREGVLLSRSAARPLTSITIASRKRDSASSSPSPPVSPAPNRPMEEAESPASVLEAPLSAADHRRLYVPENLPPLRHQDESSSQDGGGSAQVAPAERSARPGHVSCVRLTLSPKTAAATQAHTEFVQLRHSTPAGSSPDEGVGLCSPPEWSEGREAARTHTAALLRTAAALQRDDDATAAAAALRTQTAALPLLLPYKPPGSDELFYVPQTEAADQSDTTMESSHTGSDDAVPPQFSSEVLGQRDPGLDRGVTIRHSEGIYSKRSPEVSGRMQGAARRAADKSCQTSTSATLKPAEPSPRRDLPAYERRQRPSSAPQTAEAPRSGESLDELWRRFYQQWRLEGAEPSGQREALLLECLSRLVSERHAATQRREDTEGGASREHDGKRSTLRRDWTPPSAAPASRSRHFCPADRDESTTSGSASTVDTARLVRAFGAQRVQQRPRGGASLGKLYGAISRQREEGETLAPTDESTVTLDSSSCTSTHTPPPSQLRPSRLLAAKKAVRVVSRGVQAGELDIVSDATRRRTRDVGTIFPSPAATLASSSSTTPPAWGAERDRRGPRPAAKAQRKPKKSVSWFIPADDLRAEARKENSPEEASRRSVSWFEPCRRSPSWREPLRLRQIHQLPHQLPATSPKISSSHLTPLSLQEALHLRRPDFVSRSRRRMLCLLQQEEERKLHGGFGRETEEYYRLSHGVGGWTHRPAGTAAVRRAVPRKEMIQRSKQIYDNLPEIQRRREEQRRQAEYRTYRLNARLYNKRITNRVLGRRTAWY